MAERVHPGSVPSADAPFGRARPSSSMRPEELRLLRECLARCHRYLEFGSGASTFEALDQYPHDAGGGHWFSHAELVGIVRSPALLRRRRDFSPARALAMLELALADPCCSGSFS